MIPIPAEMLPYLCMLAGLFMDGVYLWGLFSGDKGNLTIKYFLVGLALIFLGIILRRFKDKWIDWV
jgi:hypothetical protein